MNQSIPQHLTRRGGAAREAVRSSNELVLRAFRYLRFSYSYSDVYSVCMNARDMDVPGDLELSLIGKYPGCSKVEDNSEGICRSE